jgi:hypothetical protein
VILTGLAIFSPDLEPQGPSKIVASQNLYSPEYVVSYPVDSGEDELANDQVIPTMYDLEDSDEQ